MYRHAGIQVHVVYIYTLHKRSDGRERDRGYTLMNYLISAPENVCGSASNFYTSRENERDYLLNLFV